MSSPSDPWLRRVQALLAKAESTEFPEEAEALLAKAQELMSRHAIDEALLAAAGAAPAQTVATVEVLVDAPYARAKASLLANVALANGCRCVRLGASAGTVRVVLVGFRSEVDSTTRLFAALTLHGARTMLSTPVPLGETARRFRHAFLVAYAHRIGGRLREAAAGAVRSADSQAREAGGASVAVALADRSHQVDRAFREAFPFTTRARVSSSSWAGATAGRAAADRADLGAARIGGGPRGLASR